MIFVVLFMMSMVFAAVGNYGSEKDGQIAPLKAEDIYADREAGKAQTSLTILNTCLSYPDRYITAEGTNTISGPHTLNMVVKNNRSTVLNPNISTVLYNSSYTPFLVANFNATWVPSGGLGLGGARCEEFEDGECEEIEWERGFCYPNDNANSANKNIINVWTPLSSVCIKVFNIFIPTPDSPSPGVTLRLSVMAENGISTIAPTSPINFNGIYVNGTYNYTLSWAPSFDTDGIAYYRVYGLNDSGGGEHRLENLGQCTSYQNFSVIPGSMTSMMIKGTNPEYFYVTAVDNLQNEGVQSRTIKCTPSGCTY